MFNLKDLKKKPSDLDEELTSLYLELKKIDKKESEDYDRITDQIAKLTKLKEFDSKKLVNPDVVFSAAANLALTLLILHYEDAHVIASKAFGFIKKS